MIRGERPKGNEAASLSSLDGEIASLQSTLLRTESAAKRSALLDKLLEYERNQAFDDNEATLSRRELIAKTVPLKIVRSSLRNDELLLEYVLDERASYCGENVLITRKGAVRAREGDMGIIPGSMGARSYIVRGKGNPESFMSCSHGAGRAMSRAEAKRRFTLDDHAKATSGVECRKDADVIDETPMAYKSIDAVMEAQRDLVDVVHTLRQVVCVKG